MTNWGAGMTSARGFQRTPAHRGVKSRSCGLVQLIGTVDSATPHPDPSGGQAPALHFLIPPSAIGLQFGTFRRWRAGIEVDWRAHPVSGYGTCFRTNDDVQFADYRNGLVVLTVSINCLSAWENALEVPNIKELKILADAPRSAPVFLHLLE